MNVDPNTPIRLADLPPASPAEQAAREKAVREGMLRERVAVKFLDDFFAWTEEVGYVAGDVAGFEPAYAARLCASGVATTDLNAGPKPKPRPTEKANGALTAAIGGNVAVRFLKVWECYCPDDVAGFNPALARELVVKGYAERTDIAKPRRTLKMIRDAIMKW